MKTDLRCQASGGPGWFPKTPQGSTHDSCSRGQGGPRPWGGGAHCQGASSSHPSWLEPRAPLPPMALKRGQWCWPCFQEGRVAQPSALVLGHQPAGISRRPGCPGAGRSPPALGSPAVCSLRLGLPGTKPTFGFVQKWQQAEHWDLAGNMPRQKPLRMIPPVRAAESFNSL